MINIEVYSTKGKKKINQDRYFVCDQHHHNLFPFSLFKRSRTVEKPICISLCDGVTKGYKSQRASRLACNLFSYYAFTENHIDLLNHINSVLSTLDFKPGTSPAATTFVGGVLYEDSLYYSNVGDSKLFLIRNNEITQLSKDHIPANSSENPHLKHVLTSCLGINRKIEIQQGELDLVSGDILLFTTDGLLDGLNEDDINSSINKYPLQTLADKAISAGSLDNISMIKICFEKEEQ